MFWPYLRDPTLKEKVPSPEPSSTPDPTRRKQGAFFIFLGVTHCLLMAFASLYALGMLPSLSIGVQKWNNLYSAFRLYLYLGCVALIVGQYLKTYVYLPQAVADCLIGASVFQAAFWAVRKILIHGRLSPWISLLPGLFLVFYGRRLRQGRALWRGLEFD